MSFYACVRSFCSFVRDTISESLSDFSPEDPNARRTTLESAQYRSQGHCSSSFLCETAHAPKRSRPIDQRANQS